MIPPTAAVVLAGGSGTRAGTGVNKVYVPVAGRPVLAHALVSPLACPFVRRVVVVVRAGDEELAARIVRSLGDPRLEVTTGGTTRSASEVAGLDALSGDVAAGDIVVVAVHDGARPLASPALWTAVVTAAAARGGAVPVLPLRERLYETAPGGLRELDSDTLVRVQTPQAFLAAPLDAAFRRAAAAGFAGPDTAATVERFSDLVVAAVPGEPGNLKVTFGGDLARVENLLADGGVA